MDFAHRLTQQVMQLYHLHLKLATVVMLLRNLILIKKIQKNMSHLPGCNAFFWILLVTYWIKCRFLSCYSGNSTLFSNSDLYFELKREQSSIRINFAMTIRKFQRQTLQIVVIFQLLFVLSHVLIYAAFSRYSSMNNIEFSVIGTKK